MSDNSLEQIFEDMMKNFNAEKAEGVDAVFQFDMTGDDGGKYWLKIVNGEVTGDDGEHESPTMVLTADTADYKALMTGDLNPMMAFMQGKIKVKGDMGLALKLQAIFDLG